MKGSKTWKEFQTDMYYRFLLVTPEMAAEWLKTNERNRTPNRDKMEKIKNDMQEGNFEFTHQAIAFDKEGNLIDGQHRLTGIVETGVTVPLAVAFNARRSTNMDSGTKRTQKQALYMAGVIEKGTIEYDPLTYPLITFAVYRNLGEERIRKLTPLNRHNLYKQIRSIVDPIIEIGSKANGRCRSAVILYAMACAYNDGVDIETLKKWHKIVETGDFYVEDDDELTRAGRSVLKFKEVAGERQATSVTRSKREEIEAILKKAMSSIYHYSKKHPIGKLYGELVYDDISVTEEMLTL